MRNYLDSNSGFGCPQLVQYRKENYNVHLIFKESNKSTENEYLTKEGGGTILN